MDIVHTRGFGPRFEYKQWKKVISRNVEEVVGTREELEEQARNLRKDCRILGKISIDTAKEWTCWDCTELYIVAYYGDLCFVLPEGYIL